MGSVPSMHFEVLEMILTPTGVTRDPAPSSSFWGHQDTYTSVHIFLHANTYTR